MLKKKQQQLLYTERRIHIEPTHFCLSCNIDTKKARRKRNQQNHEKQNKNHQDNAAFFFSLR